MTLQTRLALLATTLLPLTARAADPPTPDLSPILGVTHIHGQYALTPDQDFLTEGANQVLATGSEVLKLELMQRYAQKYAWNTTWPENIDSLTALAQSPPYRSAFHKPFKTFILTTYAFAAHNENYWTAGVTPEDAALETRQFHDLAAYFLTAYKGTGKTFILSHWEGDWALRHPRTFDKTYTPTDTAIQGMIAWLNARQAGIVQARNEHPDADVHVYGATEANLVKDSINGRPGVANAVLPNTTVDLVEYSAWDTQSSPTDFPAAVDFLAAHLPNTAAFGRSPRSVLVGEFGANENHPDSRPNAPTPQARIAHNINNVLDTVLAKHVPYAVYWEIYCNERKSNQPATAPVTGDNDAVKGFWMVKPDATPATAWHLYRQLITTSQPDRATATAIKSHLTLLFQDTFDRPDSKTDLGPAWTQNAHYAPISGELKDHKILFTMQPGTTPWTNATLDLTNPKVLGRGLRAGEYAQVTLRRVTPEGGVGVELFASDQLRQGPDLDANPSPLQAWTGKTWTPISLDKDATPRTYDWTHPHTFGVRFDSADGHFATFSYYLDDAYAGAWLVKTPHPTLDKFGVYAQSRHPGATLEVTDLQLYGHR